MRHGSLFSGIGGFDLAARWMGWDNVFHVEFNPWCRKVLEYHFPESQSHNDVKQFDGTAWRGKVDIISGGFPCQPYSAAGKRMGKDDERHLWPEMLRIIREAAPAYVVGENVRGLTNWNGGVVFEEVCADLEAAGYEVWAGILPAAGVGAPHRRDRVWFVAHAHDHGAVRTPKRNACACDSEGIPERDEVQFANQSGHVRDAADTDCQRGIPLPNEVQSKEPNGQRPVRAGRKRDAADTNGTGFEKRIPTTQPGEAGFGGRNGDADDGNADYAIESTDRTICATGHESTGIRGQNRWDEFPTQPPICGGNDGISRELDRITFSKWRNESIKAYGNAIVPQVAYQIFNALTQTT